MGEREIVFVDTNIFLELFLDQENAELCENFFEKVKENKIKAYSSDFVLYSCLIHIQLKIKSPEVMKQFIFFVNQLKGFRLVRPTFSTLFRAVQISEKQNLDFDDSLILSCMYGSGINVLVSFDKHFDKIEGIKRIEP